MLSENFNTDIASFQPNKYVFNVFHPGSSSDAIIPIKNLAIYNSNTSSFSGIFIAKPSDYKVESYVPIKDFKGTEELRRNFSERIAAHFNLNGIDPDWVNEIRSLVDPHEDVENIVPKKAKMDVPADVEMEDLESTLHDEGIASDEIHQYCNGLQADQLVWM